MSRRIATDTGGRRGPQSSRQFGDRDDNRPRGDRRMDRDDRQGNPNNMPVGVMPSMPFPMDFSNMPSGMFPPGFQFPNFQQQNQQN